VGGFRGRSSFTTWFYRILVNASLQIRRKRGRVDLLEQTSGLTAPAAVPERDEAAAAMNREIDALPMRQRTVFHLAEVEGRPLKEVAAILGLQAGTVRHHFFKARERLKDRLRPYVEHPEWGGHRRPTGSTNHES
jgi:RNA polymerase sigma-70 factor (ECF subfamily)